MLSLSKFTLASLTDFQHTYERSRQMIFLKDWQSNQTMFISWRNGANTVRCQHLRLEMKPAVRLTIVFVSSDLICKRFQGFFVLFCHRMILVKFSQILKPFGHSGERTDLCCVIRLAISLETQGHKENVKLCLIFPTMVCVILKV